MDDIIYNNSVSVKDKVITFTIKSNKTILDDRIINNEDIDINIVDKIIKEFNRISNGLIVDYNYQIIDSNKKTKTFNVEILFKHVFSKFGESQQYVNYILIYDIKNKLLNITLNEKIKSSINVNNCHPFPFNKIQINTIKIGETDTTTINAYSNNNINTYKNYNMILDFTKKLIYANYLNIDNYINISNKK